MDVGVVPVGPRRDVRWTIVVPFYNEVAYIARTIDAALSQRGAPFRLILVDNASTDATEALCRRMLAHAPHIDVLYLRETRQGPVHALAAGFARVDTPNVAFWNADTWYPHDYLARAETLLRRPGTVAAMAIDLYHAPDSLAGRLRRLDKWLSSKMFTWQAHTGTFGQCFDTAALRAAGGPRSPRWPWVLDDHVVMHRVFAFGRSRYCRDFWCMPSPRRTSKAHVRWTLGERLLYHFTPYAAKDWFFYSFLAGRFAGRGMTNANLRERCWETTHCTRTKHSRDELAFDLPARLTDTTALN